MIFTTIGFILVFLLGLGLGIFWYKKRLKQDKGEPCEETRELTLLTRKLKRMKQRLSMIKQEIRCLQEK